MAVPNDQAQGGIFRIIYIHVPMAIAALSLFIIVAIMSALSWVFHIKVANWIASVSAKVGAFCTLITLLSGAYWGYYTWGDWWVWDARLTSMLMLFFIYLAYIIIDQAAERYLISKQALLVVSVIGVIDIPLIHYSVIWWQSLHQTSTLLNLSNHTMPWEMLWPLIASIAMCALAIVTFISYAILKRVNRYESSAS